VVADSVVVAVGPLDADVAVYATDGRATSDTTVVRVVDKPFVGDVSIAASFPAYLGRRPETIPLGELVRVPRGTSLVFTGHSSTELKQVRLSREGSSMDLGVQGRRFSGSMVASASGTWQWAAEGSQGPIADLPPSLELEVLPDSAPQVEIISPSRDSTVDVKDSVRVSVLATDDHGLAGVLLRIALVNSRGEIRNSSTRALGGPSADQFAGDLVLSMAALQAGDAFKVTAIATDASPWRQVGQSRELVLRLPDASEQRDVARATADSVVAKALAAANAQRQLNQRTQDAARARERDPAKNMSYERQLADRMQQVQQAAKELEKQLGQAGALDSSLQNRLREAQRLMREALTPELAEKLRKLEQASKDMSPEDSKRALQDLAEQQRQLREMLDKSVEMLKRAALEGQMEMLKDEAKDLAQRQRQLVDSLRQADQKDEQSAAEKLAKELSEKAKDLQKDVKELQKRLQQEKAEAGAERAREAGEKIDESLEKLQEALKQGQQQQGEQQGQQGQKQPGQQQQGQQGQQGQQQQGQQQQGQQGQQGQKGQQQQGQQQQGQQGQTGQQGQQQAQNKTGAGNQGNQKGEQSGSEAAEQAAQSMEQAAAELDKAREQQVNEWKKELSGELDRSIQEMLQLAREQEELERKARGGTSPNDLRSQQSALQQGVDKAMQRLQDAGTKSSLLSQRSMRMMSDAKRKVEDATAATQRAQTGQQMASAMKESSEGLNQAAASLVRDRERTSTSNSATGFAEMLEQLQQMAKQQQGINSAMQQLMPQQQKPGEAGQEARELAREQREVANKLEESGDKDNSGRAEEMAREARQIAQQLESGQLDPAVLERQQRLFRKMLDAGRLLEEEEREDTGKREAKPWTGSEVYTPSGSTASGKAASRFTPPTWNDLRGLTPEERRLVLEYFKRINAKP
jgi:hypothetical protein